jgi:hypothetical protein
MDHPVFNSDMSIFHRIGIVFNIVIEGRISTIYHLICIESSERKLIPDNTAFSYYISVETVEVQSFLKLGSLQVLPWILRQLISYFFALIIYSINLWKTARKPLQPEMLYTHRQGRLFNLRTITPFSTTREFINGQPSHDENRKTFEVMNST